VIWDEWHRDHVPAEENEEDGERRMGRHVTEGEEDDRSDEETTHDEDDEE
jgi:hypothetical protein